jgi:hypothetical protein
MNVLEMYDLWAILEMNNVHDATMYEGLFGFSDSRPTVFETDPF